MRLVANGGGGMGGSAHAMLNVVSHMCRGTGEGLRPRPYLAVPGAPRERSG